MTDRFKGLRLARMCSGSWRLVRDLGLVRGGKGMRHFEPIMTFSITALAGTVAAAASAALGRLGGFASGRELPKRDRKPAVIDLNFEA